LFDEMGGVLSFRRSRSTQLPRTAPLARAPSFHHIDTVPFDANDALVTSPSTLGSTIPNTNCPITESHHFLSVELRVDELNDVLGHLWMAGLAAHQIRALHLHQIYNRQVVLCEKIKLHLVWAQSQVFIKPIPYCMLHHGFFEKYIMADPELKPLALGFLSTYLRLIQYESDLQVALDLKLVPQGITWSAWLTFSAQLTEALQSAPRPHPHSSSSKSSPPNRSNSTSGTNPPPFVRFNNRWDRGELRLTRLNLIFRLFRGNMRGYQSLDAELTSLFAPFFATVILLFAYIGVALSAFSVAQAGAQPDAIVVDVGYWVAIVTLLALVASVALPLVWFLMVIVDSAVYALRQRK